MLALDRAPEPGDAPCDSGFSSLCNSKRMSTGNPPGQIADRSSGDQVAIVRETSKTRMELSMNKSDLIELVTAELGSPRSHAEKAVKSVLDGILEGVERDGSVTIAGFGTFERKHRAERAGRNPRTGESLIIPASSTVGFRPAAALKRVAEAV